MTAVQIASFGVQALGMSYSSASVLVIIINGIGIPARLIPPLFADRFGPLNTWIPITFSVAVVAYCWLAVKDEPGFYVFTSFYGIIGAAFQCLIPTVVASITPRLDMVGTRLGMVFSISGFAALTGPPIGGTLQAADGNSFAGAQAWAATSTLVSFVLFAVARGFKAEWKLKARC